MYTPYRDQVRWIINVHSELPVILSSSSPLVLESRVAAILVASL